MTTSGWPLPVAASTPQPLPESKIEPAATGRGAAPVAVAGWLALATLQVLVAFALKGDSGGEPIYTYGLAVSGAVIYGFLIVASLLIASRVEGRASGVGLRRPAGRWVLGTLVVAVGGVAIAAALDPFLNAGDAQGLLPEEWRPERAAPFAVNALVIVILGPFTEELFYRGAGIATLGFLGPFGAVAGTALLWSLAHGLLAAVPPLLVFGLALGWLRQRSESVWPAAAAHALYNSVGLATIFLL